MTLRENSIWKLNIGAKCLAQGSRRYLTSWLHRWPHAYAMPESMEQNPERWGREQPIEITAEVQAKYPHYKQKLAEKNLSSQSQRKPAGVWQLPAQSGKVPKNETTASSKKIRIWKQKFFPKSRVFSMIFFQKTRLEDFRWATRRSHEQREDVEG